MTLTQLFTAIANAIRAKKGTSGTIKPTDFANQIDGIPTGIDTSDATATAEDIILNKTAYVNGQKITGTIPTETELRVASSGAAYQSNMKRLNVTYTFTDETRKYYTNFIQLRAPASQVVNAINLTADKIKKDVNILGITGTYEGEGSSEYNAKILPFNTHNRQIQSALQSFEPIDISSCTVLNYGFYGLRSLITLPYMDFSHITDASSIFSQDESLVNIPVLNFQSLTGNTNYNMFQNCRSLSNESLNNILATCITMTGVTNKTLKYIGITSAQATTCQSLSNYQAFLDAGWTTGY